MAPVQGTVRDRSSETWKDPGRQETELQCMGRGSFLVGQEMGGVSGLFRDQTLESRPMLPYLWLCGLGQVT